MSEQGKDIVKESKVLSFKNLRYWPQDGMVYIMDERDGRMVCEAPMTMRYRAVSFAQEADYMRRKGGHYEDERKELLKAARSLMEVVQTAESQGCPLDPKVMREQAQERKKVYVSLSGINVPRGN
jgi:hypothetical protein